MNITTEDTGCCIFYPNSSMKKATQKLQSNEKKLLDDINEFSEFLNNKIDIILKNSLDSLIKEFSQVFEKQLDDRTSAFNSIPMFIFNTGMDNKTASQFFKIFTKTLDQSHQIIKIDFSSHSCLSSILSEIINTISEKFNIKSVEEFGPLLREINKNSEEYEIKNLNFIFENISPLNQLFVKDLFIILLKNANYFSMNIILNSFCFSTCSHLFSWVQTKFISLKMFNLPSSKEINAKFIYQIAINNPCNLMLSINTIDYFQQLDDNYGYSLKLFSEIIRYLHFNFLRNSVIKPTSDEKYDFDIFIKPISKNDLEQKVRKLNSFKNFVEANKQGSFQKQMLTSEIKTKEAIFELMNLFKINYNKFCNCANVFFYVYDAICSNPNHIREIEEIHDLFTGMLQTIRFDHFKQQLTIFCQSSDNVLELAQGMVSEMMPHEIFNSYCERLQHIIENQRLVIQSCSQNEEIIETMQPEFEKLLIELFNVMLQPPSSQFLHELFTYDHSLILKNIDVSFRSVNDKTFYNPSQYINTNQEEASEYDIPDVCHIYQLYNESGQDICLSSMFSSFKTKFHSKRIKKDEVEDVENDLKSRFLRGLSDLYFMGYVNPSKQKNFLTRTSFHF